MKKMIIKSMFLALAMLGLLALAAPSCIPIDTDWDGYKDEEDNCPLNFNPAQSDEDNDGLGDACDKDTPLHKNTFGTCYKSNWNLKGRFWTDIETGFTPTGATTFDAYLLYPDLSGPTIEKGPGKHDGEEIWYMTESRDHTSFYATYVEGKVAEADKDGQATQIKGSYIMMVCEECSDPSVPEHWQVEIPTDEWTADIMPEEFCDGQQF
jgi:hypothetical protein